MQSFLKRLSASPKTIQKTLRKGQKRILSRLDWKSIDSKKAVFFGRQIILPVVIASSFVYTKTVWAYILPNTVTYSGTNSATLALPGNLTANLAASGTNFAFSSSISALNGLGGPASSFYSPQIAVTTPAAYLQANLGGCAAPTTTLQTCNNRGSLTVTFSQPVKNPRLHFSGIGGQSNISIFGVLQSQISYSSIFTLASASNGGTSVTPTLSLPATNSNLSLSGNSFTSTTLTNGNTSCSAASTPAGCGTLLVNGTVTQITLNIALKYAITTGSSYANPLSAADFDGVTLSVTNDEDFGDAPATFDPTQAASHVVSDLTLGTTVDAENPSTANSTTSPNAVTAGGNNNGANGDGADEDAITTFPPLTTSATNYALTVPISGASKAGKVCGWVDFNNSNTFTSTEGACSSFAAGNTSVNLNWTGLSGLTTGNRYVRLRTSYDSTLATTTPAGRLDSGEVEDYQLSITAPLSIVSISGTVFKDANSDTVINGTDAGTNAGSSTLTVYVVDSAGKVVDKALVGSNGVYTLTNVPANFTGKLRLSNDNSVAVTFTAPATPSLPTGWTNTGENLNGTPDTAAATLGDIALTTTTSNISNYNFGILNNLTKANLLMVKRVTAINGVAINAYDDDTTSSHQVEDNDPGWPTPLNTNAGLGATTISSFLKGKIDGGKVKPGDTIEYTIYFLNAGGFDATSVKLCDRIINEQTFFGTTIDLQKNNSTPTTLTSALDTDRAAFYAASSSVSTGCNFKNTPATDNGAIVVDVTGPTGSPTWLNLLGSTGSGTTDSYGFVRFTTQVNP